MLKGFARRFSRRLGNVWKLLSADEVDDSIFDKEKNLYKRGIIKASGALDMFESEVISGSELVEAIDKMGNLAYAGGPPATKCAGTYLPKFVELLSKGDIRADVKVSILKAISIITINHLEHQDQCESLGLLRQVSGIICDSESSECLLLWAIYCLHNIIVGNIRNMQIIAEDKAIHESIVKAKSLNWTAFLYNYATAVIKLVNIELQPKTDFRSVEKPNVTPDSQSSSKDDSSENAIPSFHDTENGVLVETPAK
ncbi:armadillo-like helical domain-containing protein 2 [Styela clava]